MGAWKLRSNSRMEQLHDLAGRLDALEMKASFAEDLVDELNLVVYRQQQQIDRLLLQVQHLQQQTPHGGTGAATNLRDELPPHY